MKIAKVIRIPMNEIVYLWLVSEEYTEVWFSSADIEANEGIREYIRQRYPEVLVALNEKAAEYVIIFKDKPIDKKTRK